MPAENLVPDGPDEVSSAGRSAAPMSGAVDCPSFLVRLRRAAGAVARIVRTDLGTVYAVALWWCLFGAAMFAQPQPGQSEFVPINELPATEQLPAAPLLIAAYAVVWLIAMAYVWSIWRRLGKVEHDMRDLERRQKQGGA